MLRRGPRRKALTDLWGVAGRMEARLVALGITTPRHLRDADPRFSTAAPQQRGRSVERSSIIKRA